MGKLIYSMSVSLDGYIAGPDGTFLPDLEETLDLELVETQTFGSRVVSMRYQRSWRE